MNKKKNYRDSYESTTDFFLKMMQKEKEKNLKEENKKENINYTKTIDTVGRFYNYINQTIDKILSSQVSVRVLSLVMAVALFIGISGGDILTSPTSGTTLENVNVVVEGLNEELELKGLNEGVTIGLIGPSLDIYTTNISKNYEVFVNLSGLEEGNHNVALQTRGFPDTLTVMVVPDTIDIRLAKKITQTFELEYDFINEDKMDPKYSVSVKNSAIDRVNIHASRETLDKIYKVAACIDVENKTKDFVQDAKIKVFDDLGNELDVEVAPTTVQVECSVASYSKEVNIKANFVGVLSSGYEISKYTLSQNTVTIYGLQEDIDKISEVYVNVDIDNLKQSVTLRDLEIAKQEGINKMSVEKITADVQVERVIVKEFDNIPIVVLNNSSNNRVSFAGQSGKAKVSVKGIESKISSLSADNIQATIDVNGLSRGTKKVNVKVAVDDETLEIELLSSSKVTINIERK